MGRYAVAVCVLALAPLLVGFTAEGATRTPAHASAAATAPTLAVSPSGSDTNPGTPAAPLRTIQAALSRATPGITITLAPGAYHEEPHTVVSGTAAAPITIQGPETGTDPARRHVATLYGTGRIFNVDHSYYVLRGFTIDGQEALRGTTFPTQLAQAESFKNSVASKVVDDKLIYVGSDAAARNVTGIAIDDMFLTNAGGECVRLRDGAHDNVISRTTIQWCGMFAKTGAAYGYHNGEGVYIGTSPKSTDQPMAANDPSARNTIRDSTIATFGSECMDVKENASANVLLRTSCLDNTEPAADGGSNVELRGFGNQILDSRIAGSLGYGVKISADSPAYANGGNAIERTGFSGNLGAALRIGNATPQGLFCGDSFGGGTIVDGFAIGTPTTPCPA
jgi:hypothetical protein